MTPEQLHILQHALGVDEYGRGTMFRNHFVGGEEECRPLVAMGYMTEHRASDLTGGDPWFRVTEQGIAQMIAESPQLPKLTRSQKRYREWLDSGAADCGWEFGDWLKHKPQPESESFGAFGL